MTDKQTLIYIHERLRILLQEHPNMEYMCKLRGIIDNTLKEADSELFMRGIEDLKIEEEEDDSNN